MGVRIIESRDGSMAALYDSVTETAFGPLINEEHGGEYRDAEALAQLFLESLPQDARLYDEVELRRLYDQWRSDLEQQKEVPQHG